MFVILILVFFVIAIGVFLYCLKNRIRRRGGNIELTEWDRKLMMYHEAAHATVFIKLFGVDMLQAVTIDPTNESFGNIKIINSRNHNNTKEELLNTIEVSLAGRIAEEKYLHVISTSCIHDIRDATFIANNIVCEFGMGKIGLVVVDEKAPLFCISDKLKEEINHNILEIISTARNNVDLILENSSSLFFDIVKELDAKNTIFASDLKKLVLRNENKNILI